MFEIYNVNNKIPEIRYLEMNDILQKDFINRKGIEEFERRREFFEKEGFEHWKSTRKRCQGRLNQAVMLC